MPITIQPITTIDECRMIEQLQKEIWFAAELEVIPDHLLITIAKENGMVLLARDEQANPIGFAIGFLSKTRDNQLKLASHTVGILPATQNKQVGYQIKLTQRNLALQQDIKLITWTYDPLQTRNARLNLHKLGAIGNIYLPNLYGAMRDGLNQGIASDRFQVEWWLDSDHVKHRLSNPITPAYIFDLPVINPIIHYQNKLPLPTTEIAEFPAANCLVEVPPDIDQLKKQAPQLAQAWQQQLRTIFERAFAEKYKVIDLVLKGGRIFYLLQRD